LADLIRILADKAMTGLKKRSNVEERAESYGLIASIVEKVLAKGEDWKKAAENIVDLAKLGGDLMLLLLKEWVDDHQHQLGGTLADLIRILADKAMTGLKKRSNVEERAGYGLIQSIVDKVMTVHKNVKDVAEGIVTIVSWEGEPLLRGLQDFANDHRQQLGDTLADLIIKLAYKAMPAGLKKRSILEKRADMKETAEAIIQIFTSELGVPNFRDLLDFVRDHRKQLGETLANLITSLVNKETMK